jgi:hypothetical protein
MPPPLKIELSEAQRCELEDIRDHDKRPYMRERSAAILKIADGHSGLQVARHLLNQAHWQDTIYDWVKRYQTEGVKGLEIRAGRGRKPAFFPSARDRGGRPRSN